MGIDVNNMAAPLHPETYETLGQAWIWPNKQQQVDASASAAARTASLKRRTSAQRPLRKSCSERPLSSPVWAMELLATGGSASVLDVDDSTASSSSSSSRSSDEDDEQRRQRITARAEEILRGKRCVGMLVGATCPVCLADDVDTQLSECGHLIHAKCIKRWIQSGTCCPVCRQEVVDVEEAFTSPAKGLRPLAKDRLTSSSEATYLPEDKEEDDDNQTEDAGYEWGWFEDFDDDADNLSDDAFSANSSSDLFYSSRRSLPTFPSTQSTKTPMMNRDMSATFDMCRTFPPLREAYDTPYHQSKYPWMRVLPSHRHIAAQIQIRSFRIVEAKGSKAQHAEYLIEMQLDGRYFSHWRRFSEIYRFVSSLDPNQFRQSMLAWQPIDANSRWFNRLELSYLHERCRLLEEFAHALLVECANAHPLAELVEC
ncbi:hypothetical protein PF005_g14875 [Phytophthora fragariae]|uniref:RING-type domain-containing protein n=1 Tax=Phytophthora fragariae TaxID=53985 RepID=A0A6A3TPB5_9STRA|nr:hypothetical protein PF003_g34959 [Phytophthora fragariae]KAE8933788.1 hypothetical protein PF009_g16209 [Phytophthora fragariae]KAE9001027.1 hypothetical protein PF011_g13924 [Phytophthora fragariae]KAE9101060.1 hypothetical protein PF007_g15292 [Phytophthora fragariae]KAE9138137.1 hypothetical protein PF006_g14027 [Phytophthora fragariae]